MNREVTFVGARSIFKKVSGMIEVYQKIPFYKCNILTNLYAIGEYMESPILLTRCHSNITSRNPTNRKSLENEFHDLQ